MNYLLLVKEKIIDPVNTYFIVPIITNPINNLFVTPIQPSLNVNEPLETVNLSTYIVFDSYSDSTESDETELLLHDKQSYVNHLRQLMYYSYISFTASFCFLINAWFPTILKNKGVEQLLLLFTSTTFINKLSVNNLN